MMKLMAFLGRYANQTFSTLELYTLRDLRVFADHTAQFLRDENPKKS